jgi:hypothetical protein
MGIMEYLHGGNNSFSYWYEKVKNCGIKTPNSWVYQVPTELYECFFLERSDDRMQISDFLKTHVIPKMKNHSYFLKNATFSNKFDFSHCITNKDRILNDLTDINYAALCVGANGLNEVVLREIIRYSEKSTPTIYHGLPLRNEFRVFYDFDTKNVMYSANYWDYDYVYPHLYSKTDKIIFKYCRNKIEKTFIKRQKEVEDIVGKAMANVLGFKGKWSIDILLDEAGIYWLIDMAEAEKSAYFRSDAHTSN